MSETQSENIIDSIAFIAQPLSILLPHLSSLHVSIAWPMKWAFARSSGIWKEIPLREHALIHERKVNRRIASYFPFDQQSKIYCGDRGGDSGGDRGGDRGGYPGGIDNQDDGRDTTIQEMKCHHARDSYWQLRYSSMSAYAPLHRCSRLFGDAWCGATENQVDIENENELCRVSNALLG